LNLFGACDFEFGISTFHPPLTPPLKRGEIDSMFKRLKILNGESKTITGAALFLGAASLASRLLGVFRDRVLAGQFGAGDSLDIYYAAFRIPDFIFNLLILGALSAGFIPVFMELIFSSKENGHREAWEMVNNLINIMGVILIVVCGLFIFFSSFLVPIITPGFSAEKMQTTILMTQIMMLSPLFLGISNILGGVLQSFKRFFIYSLSPIFYNIGIIIGALFLVPRFGLYGLAIGVVLGALTHMAIQIPAVMQLGFRYKPVLDWGNKSVRKIVKLMVPRTLGLAVSQINLTAITIIASTLTAGSLSIFNLSSNLQYFPIGIIGVSFAIAAFPALGECAASGNKDLMVKNFSHAVRQILFLIIPSSVLLLLLRAQIVRVILGAGAFNWEDTILTADALAIFVLSLFAQALIPLLVRFFYALQDTKGPFLIGLVSVIINIILAVFLSKPYGIIGLVISCTISNLINFCLLWIFLRIKFGSLDEGRILKSILKISVAAVFMAIVIQPMKYFLSDFVNMQTFLGIFFQGLGAGLAGIVIFATISLLLKSEEMLAIWQTIKYKLFKVKPAVITEEGPK